MGAAPAISVHDNLAARKTGIAMRPPDDKLASRVDVVYQRIVEERLQCRTERRLHPWNHDIDHILADLCQHSFVFCKRVVLGRDHDRVDALRLVIVAVLNGHLAFAVGAQVGHHLPFAAYVGQLDQDFVRQIKWQRHVVVRLIGRIAKHHTLVTSTLVFRIGTLYPLVDIGRLLVDGRENTTGMRLEHVFGLGVADAGDHLPGDLLHIQVYG